MNNLSLFVRNIIELGKIKVTVSVAISGAIGYILAGGHLDFNLLLISISIFILAVGGASLNNVQEVDLDKFMERTKHRPLPDNKMSKRSALIWSVVLLVIGFLLLFICFNYFVFLVGVLTFLCYNAIYTPLKKTTILAVIPGSLSGVLPFIIGWSAAGGSLYSIALLILSAFIFVWQIPHSWLIMLLYENDYSKAGFQIPMRYYKVRQLKIFIYFCIILMVLFTILLYLFGYTTHIWVIYLLLVLGIDIIFHVRFLIWQWDTDVHLRKMFVKVNIYVLLVLIILSIDRLT